MNEKWGLSLLYTTGHKEIIDLSEAEKQFLLEKVKYALGKKISRMHNIIDEKQILFLSDAKTAVDFNYVVRAKLIGLSGYNPLNEPENYENPLS